MAVRRQAVEAAFDYLRQFGLRLVQIVEVVEHEGQRRARLHCRDQKLYRAVCDDRIAARQLRRQLAAELGILFPG